MTDEAYAAVATSDSSKLKFMFHLLSRRFGRKSFVLFSASMVSSCIAVKDVFL
jgi:hypothetical protein